MIDLHSHFLPAIDDGARTNEEALALIKQSVDSGVVSIMATPHLNIGRFDNDLNGIHKAFDSLSSLVTESGMRVNLAYAAEVRICPEIMLLAKQKLLPFMGKYQGNDLLLLEFPDSHIPPGSDKLVKWLLANKITPMIAHPERNRELWQRPSLINDFMSLGCLLQLTAAAIIGDFGERSEKLAFQYLEADMVHIVASDMHTIKRRPSKMTEAYTFIKTKFGQNLADRLCIEQPGDIFISNQTLRQFNGG